MKTTAQRTELGKVTGMEKKKSGKGRSVACCSDEGNCGNLSRDEDAQIRVEKYSKSSIDRVRFCNRLARFDVQIHSSSFARELRNAGHTDIKSARGIIAKSHGGSVGVEVHGVGSWLRVVAKSKAKPNKFKGIL